ncbi:MAG: hypothetical protein KDA87_21175 [Planctomycetales bacterium]|nr:hypothetical protein [Planctomycetales bacterium]
MHHPQFSNQNRPAQSRDRSRYLAKHVTANTVATDYVDAALDSLRRHDMMRCPDPRMPSEMRDPHLPATDDWLPWQPIASSVTDQDIADLEAHFGGPLPSSYATFLKYRHFYDLTECGVRFERHVIGRWKEELLKLFNTYQQHFPSGSHLVPFGHETFMDAGPVCFDYQNRHANGDCSIVIWDHEWVNTDQEVKPMFSSSQKMFEALTFVATSEIGFVYGDPDEDSEEELIQKGHLLARFLAIDPNGTGGPAREYWTGWGVTPQIAK